MKKTIKSVSFEKIKPSPDANQIASMFIQFEDGHTHVPNGAFSLNNPALCLMAHCGVRPSNIDDIEGCVVPVDLNERGCVIKDRVIDEGRERLEQSYWGPMR